MDYSIKQVAEKTSLKPHVLRYYEQEGLLPDISRSESGMRRYSEYDLEWLGLICCLKNTGMTIKQIREFVALSMQGDETLRHRCDMLIEHKKNVEGQIRDMEQHLHKVCEKIECFSSRYNDYQQEKSDACLQQCGTEKVTQE
ncbi:MAG: MerR family transcriptional regulator [Acetanaerobacterium sp.]